jgi:uncharacterized protein (TIGR02147 family)
MEKTFKDGIFAHSSYREYLNAKFSLLPKRGHGIRNKLATALRCEPSYVSRVLQGGAHFSLEQADLTNIFLGHSDEESTYFLLLVQRERAGTETLRKRFERDLEEIRRKRLILKHRFRSENEISEKDQFIYFSQWLNAAVHVALTIPSLQEKEALSQHFGLPVSKIAQILDFLVSLGLAEEVQSKYVTGNARLHLGNDSPLIAKNHIDWRLQSIRSLEKDEGPGLHYSSVVSVAEKDFERLKAKLVLAIEEFKTEVRNSPPEKLCGFTMDLFDV